MAEVIATDELVAWYRSRPGRGTNRRGDVSGRSAGAKRSSSRTPILVCTQGDRVCPPRASGSAGKAELRIVYAFDPNRDAVLIVGGDKSGEKGFYERIIALAERVWREYLKEQGFAKKK